MARKAIYGHATYVDPTTYPDDGSSPVGTTEWNLPPDAEGMFGNTPATTTVSIATGDLTVTDSVTVAAAQTGTTDILDKLLITNTNEYDLIYLFAKTGQTITLTNTASPSVSGQVKTISGANEILSTTKPTILIRNGNYWYGYGGGTTADGSVTNVKLADMAANTVKVRDASSSGVPSDKAVADTQILIGDGTGFTAASLSGDATMTNAGVVTVSNSTTTTTNANLTGIVTSVGNATAIANNAIAVGKISGFDTQVQTSKLNQMAAPTASVAFNSQNITGLLDGVNPQDAATKSQVDVAQAGLDAKDSCRVATVGTSLTLSGEQTIDGVTTTTDRILVKDQSTASQNGIYVTATGAWARATDADANAEVTSGLYTFITEGTTLGGQGFVLTTDDPITVGITNLTFSQFSGVGDLVAGTGITKTVNTIAIDSTVTTLIGTQILTNKTLTSPTINTSAISGGNAENLTIGSSIASPSITATVLTVTSGGSGITAPNISVYAQAGVKLSPHGSSAGNTAEVQFLELAANGTNKVSLKAPDALAADVILTLPNTDGASGEALKTDGSGVLSWGAAGGGTEKYVTFDNTAVTTYAGVSTTFVTSGVATRDIYIKKIDSNNEGVFTKIFKNGSAVEVQIA